MRDDTVGRPMEILFVEDSFTFAFITIRALRNSNIAHRLTWLTDGEQALDFIHRRRRFSHAPRPDLVLLDLGLPKMDGIELLRELNSQIDLIDIPVVVMTASTHPSDEEDCEALHVDGYLTKPINLDKFLMIVAKLKRYWHEDMILPTMR